MAAPGKSRQSMILLAASTLWRCNQRPRLPGHYLWVPKTARMVHPVSLHCTAFNVSFGLPLVWNSLSDNSFIFFSCSLFFPFCCTVALVLMDNHGSFATKEDEHKQKHATTLTLNSMQSMSNGLGHAKHSTTTKIEHGPRFGI